MFEKVQPSHVDKIADRIAGAIVDLSYKKANGGKELCYNKHPRVAVEVLIGHGYCFIINETSEHIEEDEIYEILARILRHSVMDIKNVIKLQYLEVPQDVHLASNQAKGIRCGDNGIFKGMPITDEERELTRVVQCIYNAYPYDGKYIINNKDIIACQSNCKELPIKTKAFNPLGYWVGGLDSDSGATNRKLGSDMGDAVTGGGLHGKDLSKADVSVNIYCYLLAQRWNSEITACCAIGDEGVYFKGTDFYMCESASYEKIVKEAVNYIKEIGGFEKLAEWGLIR